MRLLDLRFAIATIMSLIRNHWQVMDCVTSSCTRTEAAGRDECKQIDAEEFNRTSSIR